MAAGSGVIAKTVLRGAAQELPQAVAMFDGQGVAVPTGSATAPLYTVGSRMLTPVFGAIPNTLVTYTAGLSIGGLVTVATGLGAGTFLDITLLRLRIRAANQASGTPNYNVVFFSTNPSASTITDNAAVNIAAADGDRATLVGVASWAYSNATTGVATATANGPRLPVDVGGNTYFALVATGSTPLLAANALTYSFEAKY